MARDNNTYAKRQRETIKRQKQEAKRERRKIRKEEPAMTPTSSEATDMPAEHSPMA
jgi:hypothetical protein